jgi:threonine aldolase
VLLHDDFKRNFRNYIKQNGAMLAKGWLLGAQFDALFRDGLYFEIGKSAIDYALAIREAFLRKGFEPFPESPTNQQFFLLPADAAEKLGKKHIYEFEGTVPDGRHICRFCTGWHTQQEDVDELLRDIETL